MLKRHQSSISVSLFLLFVDVKFDVSMHFGPDSHIASSTTRDRERKKARSYVSLAPPLPVPAAPDDPLLELAPPPRRNRDRGKQTETEKCRKNHRSRKRKHKREGGVTGKC